MKQFVRTLAHVGRYLAMGACLFATCGVTHAWVADNGNGTYTNPLFFEEFSDPCMIRVGSDFYLTGTTMHTMPGLPILHSRDLVNWRLISYVFDRFNLGPEFSFQEGRQMYGQGIWAPSFAYADGTFYIFANVNGHTTQCYKSRNPYGPWEHWEMKQGFHDLTLFFDDDGKKYICWGAMQNYLAQLNEDMSDIIPETRKMIARSGAEGGHLYKVNGEYIIVWAVPGSNTPQLAGKSKNIYGPYEIVTISSNQNCMGVHGGYGLGKSPWRGADTFEFYPPSLRHPMTLHQGGIIDTPSGEWWGYSMQDHNSLGRVTNLTPVTWENGFPYFGLPGNLAMTPRTWIKPQVDLPQQPIVPLAERDDDFSSATMKLLWQWNHLPDDSAWSLTERPGMLRLHSLPAKDFWLARNTLTQRSVGLEATCSVSLDATGLQEGDVAGLALLNYPYAWIGIRKVSGQYQISFFDQTKGDQAETLDIPSPLVRLSVHTDFETEKAQFMYQIGLDETLHKLGNEFQMVFQLRTFQGVRYGLFHYNEKGQKGGYADFDNYQVKESVTGGFRNPIPYGSSIVLNEKKSSHALAINGADTFNVEDRSLGRVALKCPSGYLAVDEQGAVAIREQASPDEISFQWIELENGDLVLLSLKTHRYLQREVDGKVNARVSVPSPDRQDGTRFNIKIQK